MIYTGKTEPASMLYKVVKKIMVGIPYEILQP